MNSPLFIFLFPIVFFKNYFLKLFSKVFYRNYPFLQLHIFVSFLHLIYLECIFKSFKSHTIYYLHNFIIYTSIFYNVDITAIKILVFPLPNHISAKTSHDIRLTLNKLYRNSLFSLYFLIFFNDKI